MRRAVVRLSLSCSNRCLFCCVDGLAEPPDPRPIDERLAAARQTSDELTLTGGEPSLHPDLEQWVHTARKAGFTKIGLQSNGRGLNPDLARRLSAAGLTDVHLTVLGSEARVHDYHTGVEGSFAALLSGAAAGRAAGLSMVASTILTRSNFPVLAPVPGLLKKHGFSAWCITTSRVAGRAAALRDQVIPRLGLALPYALHALSVADAIGLPALIEGAPLCALGPFAARAVPSTPRAYAPPCDGCPSRDRCPGVDPVYLRRFGAGELSPTSAVAPQPEQPFSNLFVGPGELATREDLEVPLPPEEARARRSELGKVRPAAQEVRSAQVQRSGESLKQLFPRLFPSAVNGAPADEGQSGSANTRSTIGSGETKTG